VPGFSSISLSIVSFYAAMKVMLIKYAVKDNLAGHLSFFSSETI
jgi:hypothetical protein